jgi:hypothetical protein
MAAGQLFGSAPRARMGHGKRLEREVRDDPGDGPAWQLGWLSVFGPKSRI